MLSQKNQTYGSMSGNSEFGGNWRVGGQGTENERTKMTSLMAMIGFFLVILLLNINFWILLNIFYWNVIKKITFINYYLNFLLFINLHIFSNCFIYFKSNLQNGNHVANIWHIFIFVVCLPQRKSDTYSLPWREIQVANLSLYSYT